MSERIILAFCDGGAKGNPGPGAAACVIEDPAEKKRFLCGKYLGETTNNQAEYAAVKLALETIKARFKKTEQVKLFLDSKLAVNQLNGFYKVKESKLREFVFSIRELEVGIGEVYYQYISREKNAQADALVKQVISLKSNFQQSFSYKS